MLKQLNIKKEYLLIAGTILLAVACYHFAISKTVEEWQLNKRLNKQLTQSADVSIQPSYLIRKSANLSKTINLYRVDTSLFRSNTINQISAIAQDENVKLSDIPVTDPTAHTVNFTIQKLTFEGDFFQLLKLTDKLSKTHGIGVIRSFTFKVVTSRQHDQETKILTLDVIIEYLTNQNK